MFPGNVPSGIFPPESIPWIIHDSLFIIFARGALAFAFRTAENTLRFAFPDDPWILVHTGNISQKYPPVTFPHHTAGEAV